MWYILNYIPLPGQRRSNLPSLIDSFNDSLIAASPSQALTPNDALQLFAPTFISLTEARGKVEKAEKPLLYHYIFIKGPLEAVRRLCLSGRGFSFILSHTASRYLSVSDETLEQFRIVAHYHSGKLPCYPLEGINLEEGDRVQIVSGPCAGLTGTYISRKGAKSGNVLVAIDGSMAAIVYDVKAEFVRVLEFASNSRRLYDQLDAYASRLAPLLVLNDTPRTPRRLPVTRGCVPTPREVTAASLSDIAAASVFTRRLGSLKAPNPKIAARLYILLYAAYSLLGDVASARTALKKFRNVETHVTNPHTLTLISSILTTFPPTDP